MVRTQPCPDKSRIMRPANLFSNHRHDLEIHFVPEVTLVCHVLQTRQYDDDVRDAISTAWCVSCLSHFKACNITCLPVCHGCRTSTNLSSEERCCCREYFDGYDQKPERSQVAVFDIDETALSNRAEWLTSMVEVCMPLCASARK